MPELGFVHEFVPASDGSDYTLLLLHGTGGDERDLIPLGARIGGGAALLSPRGKSTEEGMNRFFRRRAMGVFDLEDLRFRTHELGDFVEGAAKHYHLDGAKIVALGYSNGANIAASMLLLRPGILSGAILLRPMIPLIPDQLPDLLGVPIWIGGGKQDPIVPPRQTTALADMLAKAGAQVKLYWSPGGHELNARELEQAREWWLAGRLQNRPAEVLNRV